MPIGARCRSSACTQRTNRDGDFLSGTIQRLSHSRLSFKRAFGDFSIGKPQHSTTCKNKGFVDLSESTAMLDDMENLDTVVSKNPEFPVIDKYTAAEIMVIDEQVSGSAVNTQVDTLSSSLQRRSRIGRTKKKTKRRHKCDAQSLHELDETVASIGRRMERDDMDSDSHSIATSEGHSIYTNGELIDNMHTVTATSGGRSIDSYEGGSRQGWSPRSIRSSSRSRSSRSRPSLEQLVFEAIVGADPNVEAYKADDFLSPDAISTDYILRDLDHARKSPQSIPSTHAYKFRLRPRFNPLLPPIESYTQPSEDESSHRCSRSQALPGAAPSSWGGPFAAVSNVSHKSYLDMDPTMIYKTTTSTSNETPMDFLETPKSRVSASNYQPRYAFISTSVSNDRSPSQDEVRQTMSNQERRTSHAEESFEQERWTSFPSDGWTSFHDDKNPFVSETLCQKSPSVVSDHPYFRPAWKSSETGWKERREREAIGNRGNYS
jgi:hypothetical protein